MYYLCHYLRPSGCISNLNVPSFQLWLAPVFATFNASPSSIIRGWDNSSVVALDAMALSLNKLNMALLAFTKVMVIVLPDPASSDTINYLITAGLKLGTVYSVVRSVVVKSTFLFIKLLAIIVKRS